MSDRPTPDPLAVLCVDPECPNYGGRDVGTPPCATGHAAFVGTTDIDPRADAAEPDDAYGRGPRNDDDDTDVGADDDPFGYWEDDIKPVEFTRRERLRHLLNNPRQLGYRNLGPNRQASLWLNLRDWRIGFANYYGEWDVQAGPLKVSVAQPPF